MRFSHLLSMIFLLVVNYSLFAQTSPQFSQNPGYYTSSFELQLIAGEGDEIYYTLNGDTPNESSRKYISALTLTDRSTDSHSYSPWVAATGSIQLITVIRARSKNGDAWSETTSGTFIIHPDGKNRYHIPMVSLITDSLNLFDYNTGIYVLGKYFDEWKANNPSASEGLGTPANYTQRGDEWERPAHFEFFNQHGELGVSQPIGIRIHGGGSRSFQQKSFRLYARSEYGKSKLRYLFFLDQDLDEYKRLQLRNSGQDWMKSALRDGFMQTLVRHLPFETMAFRQNLLFLNGEFWGIANIRERYDEDYLSIKFDVEDTKIDYLSGNASIEDGSKTHYINMLNYIRTNGLSNQQHYKYINTQMDVQSFINYTLSNIYFNNRDWPHNNIDYWRYQTAYDSTAGPGRDGRWRWMMFDNDFGFAWTDIHTESKYQGHVTQNYLQEATRADHWSSFLLFELLKNQDFKAEFINTYRDLMNTAFAKPRVLAVLDSVKNVIAPYVKEHIDRWGNSDHRWSMPHDYAEWETNINFMARFSNERETYMNQYFRDQFSLDSLYTLEVSVGDPSMGFIRINNTDIKSGTPNVAAIQYPELWTGDYFKNQPITVKAVAKEGYRFSHWENHNTGESSLTVTDATAPIVAYFEPETVSVADQNSEIPNQTELFANYPNPFNPSTTISFQLAENSSVKLSLFNIQGQQLKTLFSGNLKAGRHSLSITLAQYATGMYMYRLETPKETLSGKMMLVK